MSSPSTSTAHEGPTESEDRGEDNTNAYMRWAKKPWNHVGFFSREEAAQLLRDKMVSQKRRMLMKDCVRIIYYCQVQRSSGCRYEMSICIPKDEKGGEEKIRIDDYNSHSCDIQSRKMRRRVLPQVEDFDRPIEKRIRSEARTGVKKERKIAPPREARGEEETHDSSINLAEALNNLIPQPAEEENSTSFNETPNFPIWTTLDIDIVDISKRPDGEYYFLMNCTDQSTRFSYASPLKTNSTESIATAILDMFYIFGPPEEIQLEGNYLDAALNIMIKKKFPQVNIICFPLKKSNFGNVVQRREAQMVKERLFAWLVENDCVNWSLELQAMKYAHNSEWIDELGGTPMDLFFRRGKRRSNASWTDGQLLQSVKFEMCGE